MATVDGASNMSSPDKSNDSNKRAGVMSPQEDNAMSTLVNRTVEVTSKEWVSLHSNPQKVAKSEADTANQQAQSQVTKEDGQHNKGALSRVVIWRKGFPILNPYTSVYIWWCGYILFTDATYTAFVVPLGVGFNTSDTQWNWSGYWDFIAGVTFSIELILGWNVAFVATHNMRKRVVFRHSKIAWFYVRHGSFLFDFISTCVFIAQCVGYAQGLTGNFGGTVIQIVQILRALRLLRLLGLLQHMFVLSLNAAPADIPYLRITVPVWVSYLAQLMFILALFINFMACTWVFVAKREALQNTWVNHYGAFVDAYAVDDASTLTQAEAEGVPGPTVWLAAAYWSLTIVSTIGFGDVLPYTNAERGVMLLAQLAGVLFFGIVLGSVTSLLQRSSREVQEAELFRGKMESVQKWMSRIKLPRELRNKIRSYFAEVWVHEVEAEDDLQLFEDLPHHLRAQVAWRQNRELMGSIHTFKDLKEEVQFLIASNGKPLKVAAGHNICRQGDSADCIWLLHEGEVVSIHHYREAEHEHAPAVIGSGALLAASNDEFKTRPCGFRAVTGCVLWEITMQNLQPIIDWQEDVATVLEERTQQHLSHKQYIRNNLWAEANQENESCAKEDEDGIDADYEDPYSFRKHGEYLKDDAGTANDDVDVSNAHGQEALHEGDPGNTEQEHSGPAASQSLLSGCTITPAQASHVIISIPAEDSQPSFYDNSQRPVIPTSEEPLQSSKQPRQQQSADMQLSKAHLTEDRDKNMMYISITPAGSISVFSRNVNLKVQRESQGAHGMPSVRP